MSRVTDQPAMISRESGDPNTRVNSFTKVTWESCAFQPLCATMDIELG